MLRGVERKEQSPSGSRDPEGRHGRAGACPLPAAPVGMVVMAPVGMPMSVVSSIVSPDARARTAIHHRWWRHDHEGSGQIRAKIYAKLEPFPVQSGTRELREVFHTVL